MNRITKWPANSYTSIASISAGKLWVRCWLRLETLLLWSKDVDWLMWPRRTHTCTWVAGSSIQVFDVARQKWTNITQRVSNVSNASVGQSNIHVSSLKKKWSIYRRYSLATTHIIDHNCVRKLSKLQKTRVLIIINHPMGGWTIGK